MLALRLEAAGSPFMGPKERVWPRVSLPTMNHAVREGAMRRDALEDAVTFRVVFHLVSQAGQGKAACGLPEDCNHV